MPIDLQSSSNARKGAMSAEDNMKMDLKQKLLSNFDLLDEQKKNQVFEYIKQLVNISDASILKSKAVSNNSPWTDIEPLHLNNVSLSDIILTDRAENKK